MNKDTKEINNKNTTETKETLYKGRWDDITNEEILKAYDNYQISIRHEGNPAGRLTKWKKLCEGFAMTEAEFEKRLKKAQVEARAEKENEEEAPPLIQILTRLYDLVCDAKDNDTKEMIEERKDLRDKLLEHYLDIDKDIVEDVIDKVWNSSIGRIIASKQDIRDELSSLDTSDNYETIEEIKGDINDWIEDDLETEYSSNKVKLDPYYSSLEEAVLEKLKEHVIELLYERAIDEVIELAKDSKYEY